MKFSGKLCLMITLKVAKNQGLPPSVEKTVLKKSQGEGSLIELVKPLQIIF